MKDSQKLISVVVPVYNVEPYLRACVESLRQQTHQNLQIILVDDGSTDSSGEMCDQFAKTDPRIIVVHQENRGLPGARNTGLPFVQGEYFCYVDSDDMVHPEYVERLLAAAEHTDADIVECKMEHITHDVQTFDAPLDTPVPESTAASTQAPGSAAACTPAQNLFVSHDAKGLALQIVFRTGVQVYVMNKLYKTNTYADLRFSEEYKTYEDSYYSPLALLRTQTYCRIDDALYGYRQRDDSIVHAPYNPRNRDILIGHILLFQAPAIKDAGLQDAVGARLAHRTAIDMVAVERHKEFPKDVIAEEVAWRKSIVKEYRAYTFKAKELPFARRLKAIFAAYAPHLSAIYRDARSFARGDTKSWW